MERSTSSWRWGEVWIDEEGDEVGGETIVWGEDGLGGIEEGTTIV